MDGDGWQQLRQLRLRKTQVIVELLRAVHKLLPKKRKRKKRVKKKQLPYHTNGAAGLIGNNDYKYVNLDRQISTDMSSHGKQLCSKSQKSEANTQREGGQHPKQSEAQIEKSVPSGGAGAWFCTVGLHEKVPGPPRARARGSS